MLDRLVQITAFPFPVKLIDNAKMCQIRIHRLLFNIIHRFSFRMVLLTLLCASSLPSYSRERSVKGTAMFLICDTVAMFVPAQNPGASDIYNIGASGSCMVLNGIYKATSASGSGTGANFINTMTDASVRGTGVNVIYYMTGASGSCMDVIVINSLRPSDAYMRR